MNSIQYIINQFTTSGSTELSFNSLDTVIIFTTSIILSFIIAYTYKYTHSGFSYSKKFTQNLVILNVIVSVLMLIIGTNIARAFTLVGALSIVRFRNAIKETWDVGYIFFTMVVGMSIGTRFYNMAIVLTLVVSTLIILMNKFNFGEYNIKEDMLKIKITNINKKDKIIKELRKIKLNPSILTTEKDGDEIELTIIIKNTRKNNELTKVLDAQRDIKSFSLIEGEYVGGS